MSDSSIIAVGVDESESSWRALEWAAQEALRRHAVLQVVTAWNWDSIEGGPPAAGDPAAVVRLAEQTQERAIAEVIGPMEPKPTLTRKIVQAAAVEALANASQDADLLVVGTHGRGPVRSLLLGSVSLSVIKHAACPVVVMPPAPAATTSQGELASASP